MLDSGGALSRSTPYQMIREGVAVKQSYIVMFTQFCVSSTEPRSTAGPRSGMRTTCLATDLSGEYGYGGDGPQNVVVLAPLDLKRTARQVHGHASTRLSQAGRADRDRAGAGPTRRGRSGAAFRDLHLDLCQTCILDLMHVRCGGEKPVSRSDGAIVVPANPYSVSRKITA